jgi:hypothetical protein
VPGPVDLGQVAVDEAYAAAQGVQQAVDGLLGVLDGPVVGVASGHSSQSGAGEQGAVDHGGR